MKRLTNSRSVVYPISGHPGVVNLEAYLIGIALLAFQGVSDVEGYFLADEQRAEELARWERVWLQIKDSEW
jgi:hypothetical protein